LTHNPSILTDLSALEFGSAAYRFASDGQIKRHQPVHHKGLSIAIGEFCVCRTEKILCESGFESLAERRRRKTINTAIHIVENESHPVNEWLREEEAFDNYALNMKLTIPFFINPLETCATLDVDLNMVEKASREEHPPWIGGNMENIITSMMAVPKEAGTARPKAELEQTIEEEGLQEFTRVYTVGSVMEDRVGCSVICGPKK
jgi:hypothetical protein